MGAKSLQRNEFLRKGDEARAGDSNHLLPQPSTAHSTLLHTVPKKACSAANRVAGVLALLLASSARPVSEA